ncbi:adenylate/guanylate cyclase domain-containing protein [Pelomonas aquatica]|jgi:class 3 adenylate cyclase|uniref:Adenylate/guanylate cyclase domain-containing protein n=1 Tax=Pelomonas aquatica TaxID=431058 RepID=A0A9X4LFQ4_9BURK|nr:adenylate/guanylate cyclase domain-containing protein [Pelomonas aquatica]MCY4754778.1 adenylate/guanylate cyclase domain-containing protein [Pelomonas aquatica]MDG0861909.1 adenylate/guanylate cyclase domain-containing protein [Pelomonas aquatica]
MTAIRERTVLFADLRGSTGLYESLGNAEASGLVTQTVSQISEAVLESGGHLIKTLGDGLMAAFETPRDGVRAAQRMQEMLERTVQRARRLNNNPAMLALRLQVALARGEVVELNGDCFGDAVNVAARLIDHAGDGEILITAEVLAGLHHASKGRFRSLDRISVRGRIEPVHVHRMDAAPLLGADAAATQFGEPMRATEPDGMRLVWGDLDRVFDILSMPVILGRSVQATYCITDARVSRSHARIDWQGSSFELTDLSYNGTYVRFGDSGELLSLKRGSCTLHGGGSIGLGGPPGDQQSPSVRFEVLHFADTEPQAFGGPRSRR